MTRRDLLTWIPLAMLPSVATGQGGRAESPAAALTPEQFDRMYKRLLGKWRMDLGKSTFMGAGAPKNPSSFIYTATPDLALEFTNENGYSAQKFDGKLYDGSPTIPGTMVSRTPTDEFTIEIVLSRNGTITNRNTQVYLPDGIRAIYISRSVNDAGERTPNGFHVYEKVPDTVKLWWEKA
jgi:hypothetical protein